jgi:hypothetical protein
MYPPLISLALASCARTDIYYPSNGKDVVVDERGRVSRHHQRAVVLNGSDSLGDTVIDVTSGGVRLSSAGGIDNSTSTREGYRTARFGMAAAAWGAAAAAVAGQAASAYNANQASNAASNVAASKAAANAVKPLPSVGSTIPAQTQAVVTPVP